ncbi:uncharacterized protein LOC111048038 [Nilaparvata lugens]|uniref:uncharacterized protein LOC111048038 n=1 Tax=Nilaparvata lugens TaxID=108931 RepID=UPI00193D3D7E|nr:uncharacterized protein LOC111048038 [Nilaparvata lugens]
MNGNDHQVDAVARRQDDDVIPTLATEKEKRELEKFTEATGLHPPKKLPSPPPLWTPEGRLRFPSKLYEDLTIISRPLDLTTCVYKTVKNSNFLFLSRFLCDQAERTVGCLRSTAGDMITYILNPNLIKDVDDFLCSALDCVETTVPCIKKSPATMMVYVCTGKCALDCVCQTIELTIEIAGKLINLVICKKYRQKVLDDINSQVIPTRT